MGERPPGFMKRPGQRSVINASGLDDRPLGASEWADAACRRLLAFAVPRIVDTLAPWKVRLVFLGGSAALGEAVAWRAPGEEPLLLSDLDLGVVAEQAVPPAAREGLRRSLHQEDSPARSLCGGAEAITVGTYTRAAMDRQIPTLGHYDLVQHGRILWGDASLFARFQVPARVPAWEGIRLAGNRALELLARSERPPGPRAVHALAKAVTGLWTSWLAQNGLYRPRWSARRELLGAGGDPVSEAGAEAARAASAPAAIREEAARWSPFLEDPGPGRLPAAGERLSSYRRALWAWLESLPRLPGAPEGWFLREPCGVRDWIRRWRAASWPAAGAVPGRTPGSIRHWSRLAPALAAGEMSTPEGRRMAAAVLYWRRLPESPEPVWGDLAPDPGPQWSRDCGALLGCVVAAGPGCREGLRRALGLAGQG